MKCSECNLWWVEKDYIGCCHADPNWPAPCEYEDDYEEKEDYDD